MRNKRKERTRKGQGGVMEKRILHMQAWELYKDIFAEEENLVDGNDYFLLGITYEYPDTCGMVGLQTTVPVVSYSVEEDVLTYETEDTIYICPFACMEENPYATWETECLEELEELVKEPKNELDCILYASVLQAYEAPLASSGNELVDRVHEWMERNRQERLAKIAQEEQRVFEQLKDKENYIYIAFSQACENKLFYHIGEKSGVAQPLTYWRSGNENRELYLLYEENSFSRSLDFRYVTLIRDVEMEIKTYNWTADIQRAIIKNATENKAIRFNGEVILPGATKEFTRKTHEQGIIALDEM